MNCKARQREPACVCVLVCVCVWGIIVAPYHEQKAEAERARCEGDSTSWHILIITHAYKSAPPTDRNVKKRLQLLTAESMCPTEGTRGLMHLPCVLQALAHLVSPLQKEQYASAAMFLEHLQHSY